MHIYNLKEKDIPNKLYRYTPWTPFTKNTIECSHIYLSSVNDFNDKYEFRINSFYMMNEFDKDKYIEEFEFTIEDHDETEEFIQRSRAINRSLEAVIDREIENTRVACFTNSNNNTMMWYHYADKYKGVCLEWTNLHNDILFSSDKFGKVEYGSYADAVAKINEHILQNINGQFDVSAPNTWVRYFFKSPNWSCENEYRLIRLYTKATSSDDFFDFDRQRLTGIYCGVDMSENDKREVYEFTRSINENITVYEAKLNRDGFGFIFEPYRG